MLSTGTCSFDNCQLNPSETSLIASQSAIGWRNLLLGRLSNKWSSLQQLHVTSEKLSSTHYSGASWSVKVIQHIWRALHSLWKLRNTSLHGTTFSENVTTRRTRIESLVRQLNARIDELGQANRAMLRTPLDDRLKQPLSVIKTWLSLAQPAFDAACNSDSEDDEETLDDPDAFELVFP